MLKQDVNLDRKKFIKKFKKKSKYKKNFKKKRIRKSLALKRPYFFNKTFLGLKYRLGSLKISNKINIKMTANNVFCTLSNVLTKKTKIVASSGKYKIKTSKRSLKFSSKTIVEYFFKEIKKYISKKFFLISIIAPTRVRRPLIKTIKKIFKKTPIIIQIKEKKCFNGCRPAKKRRKKRKGFRIFK